MWYIQKYLKFEWLTNEQHAEKMEKIIHRCAYSSWL